MITGRGVGRVGGGAVVRTSKCRKQTKTKNVKKVEIGMIIDFIFFFRIFMFNFDHFEISIEIFVY